MQIETPLKRDIFMRTALQTKEDVARVYSVIKARKIGRRQYTVPTTVATESKDKLYGHTVSQ